MIGKIVCLINRTERTLVVTKGGRDHPMTPGENYVNEDLVPFAFRQHPIPGSRDRQNPMVQGSLFARKGTRDDASLISNEELALLPEEILDRSTMSRDFQRNSETIRPRHPIRVGRVPPEGATAGMIDPGKFGGVE